MLFCFVAHDGYETSASSERTSTMNPTWGDIQLQLFDLSLAFSGMFLTVLVYALLFSQQLTTHPNPNLPTHHPLRKPQDGQKMKNIQVDGCTSVIKRSTISSLSEVDEAQWDTSSSSSVDVDVM